MWTYQGKEEEGGQTGCGLRCKYERRRDMAEAGLKEDKTTGQHGGIR